MKLLTLNTVLSLAVLQVLVGCHYFKKNVVEPKPVASPSTVTQQVAIVDKQTERLHADVAANVETARKANSTQPETAVKSTVEGELDLASKRLNTKPSDAELLAGEQRARALAEGRTDEARKLYAEASKQANEDAKARAKAESDLQAALEKQAKDAAQYKADLAAFKADSDKKLEAARSEVMRDQVKWLNRTGAICAAIAIAAVGLSLAFGGMAAFRVSGPFAAIFFLASLLCFGMAQIVGAWWFKWAAFGCSGIVAAVVGAWIWRHAKQQDLKQEVEHRAENYSAVLKQVVPVLDNAYEAAEKEGKDLLDKLIFSRLSSVMNKDDKATVHEIRAENIK